jgi:hypothetical protein
MRKTITMLTAVGALAALAVGASPAAADDPNAKSTITNLGTVQVGECRTPNKPGVRGAFGAWGHYIDGCTIRVQCPQHLSVCAARAESRIGLRNQNLDHRVTLNSRTRVFLNAGTDEPGSEIWHRDVSCDSANWCRAEDDVIHLRGGQYVSVQCNGVRESVRSPRNSANVSCSVKVQPA